MTDGSIDIDAAGTTLEVRVLGDASGPTVIWGHGLMGSIAGEDELPLIDWASAAPGHRVVRYDARGHGQSVSTDGEFDYRWDRLADDQLALADALGIERYTAAGASMGAATALYAALAAPERIERLVLVIPPTAWETRRDQVDLYATMADLIETGRTDVLLRGADATPLPDPLDERSRERHKGVMTTTDAIRLARVLRGAGRTDLPPREEIMRLAQPALILAWTGDPGHPVSTAEQLAELLPNSSVRIASEAAELATWPSAIAGFLER
ncbi:MAG: alpha/beta hydrolase [Actinomycetota bacterium]